MQKTAARSVAIFLLSGRKKNGGGVQTKQNKPHWGAGYATNFKLLVLYLAVGTNCGKIYAILRHIYVLWLATPTRKWSKTV